MPRGEYILCDRTGGKSQIGSIHWFFFNAGIKYFIWIEYRSPPPACNVLYMYSHLPLTSCSSFLKHLLKFCSRLQIFMSLASSSMSCLSSPQKISYFTVSRPFALIFHPSFQSTLWLVSLFLSIPHSSSSSRPPHTLSRLLSLLPWN